MLATASRVDTTEPTLRKSLLFALALGANVTAAHAVTYQVTCEATTHEAWSTRYETDGSVISGHDRSTTYCFYDGQADLSEYRGLNEANQVIFHGLSVTLWNADRSSGRTLWAMVGVDGHTDIRLSWDGAGKLIAEGEGTDPEGAFFERSRSSFRPGGDYHFEMDRSYDGGETWIAPRNIIEYLRTPAEPPPLPNEWSPRLPFGAQLAGQGGMIMLDGMAWGRFTEDGQGRPTGFVFATVAPKGGAWVWRTITWTLANGVTEVGVKPLK